MKYIFTKYVFILSIISLLVTLPLTPISAAPKFTNPIRIYVEDKEIKPTVSPVLKGGRVYVEFRSIALALGFAFKYDTANQVITAGSEDISFKIDIKNGTTYIDGKLYEFNSEEPMTIASGSNTLVMIHLFNATDYTYADYNGANRTVTISENLWREPRTSDFRSIRLVIEQFFKSTYDNATITKYEVSPSWGAATVWVDAKIPKNETMLLNHLLHTEFQLERQEDNQWVIQEMYSKTEYLDYKSLARKEVEVPEPDKSSIKRVITSYFKALDEKNAEAIVSLISSDETKEELIKYYNWEFQREISKNTGYKVDEQPIIVTYNSDESMVYTVFSIKEKVSENPVHFRGYYLLPIVKAPDGKWYLSSDNEIMLGYEKLSN